MTKTIEAIRDMMPDYAKDIKLNLGNVSTETGLSPDQIWGTMVASAIATRQPCLIEATLHDAGQHVSDAVINAAKAAAALMGMNNVYYRYTGEVKEYQDMPPRLRMNFMANPGVDHNLFELFSLAVSAINFCHFCIKSHEKKLRDNGIDKAVIQNVIRIAAVINAAACVLATENACQPECCSVAA